MYIYGIHPVEEVLRRASDRVEELVVVGDLSHRKFAVISELISRNSPSIRSVSMEEMNEIADDGNHQRVAVKVSAFPYRQLTEILAAQADNDRACVVALAQVQDPGNLGAILRSAAALKVDAVLIPKHRSAQITSTVVRASAGMAFEIPIVQVTNMARALRTLKEEGYWVVGTVAEKGQKLWTMDWKLKAAIVMGGEHQGMRPGVEKECDFRVTVPLQQGVESLNVAAATAITLYDRLRSLENE